MQQDFYLTFIKQKILKSMFLIQLKNIKIRLKALI